MVTHNASPITRINYWRYCAEVVWWPWYIGSDIWFRDDFWEASSLWFQSSFSTAWYLEDVLAVFHDRLLLRRCCRGFVLPVLKYCSAVWCLAANTHLRQLDPVVSDASFLTWGVFECDLAHRRSVAVLCMLYKIRCNNTNSLALPTFFNNNNNIPNIMPGCCCCLSIHSFMPGCYCCPFVVSTCE